MGFFCNVMSSACQLFYADIRLNECNKLIFFTFFFSVSSSYCIKLSRMRDQTLSLANLLLIPTILGLSGFYSTSVNSAIDEQQIKIFPIIICFCVVINYCVDINQIDNTADACNIFSNTDIKHAIHLNCYFQDDVQITRTR